MKLNLSVQERKALKQKAHHLNPVIMIGQNGLTPPVIHEVDNALNAHELIKVRILGDDRALREQIAEELCDVLEAALVQHIGKLLILWRPKPDA